MALDILQLLFQALRVQDLAYKYTTPVDQFLYLIFFPSIIVIAIITIFTNKVFSGKLAFLFTFAFYIFIIVYPPNADKSIYSALAPLGEVWFLGFAIIAVLWFIFRFPFSHGGGKSGGGLGGFRRGGADPGLSGDGAFATGEGLTSRAKRILSGEEKDDEMLLQGYLNSMAVTVSSLKIIKDRDERAKLIGEFNSSMVAAHTLIKRITQLKHRNIDIGWDPKNYEKKFNRLISEFGKLTGAQFN